MSDPVYSFDQRSPLANMTFDQLSMMRAMYKGQPEVQIQLAPYEHAAWAREYARDNGPLAGAVVGGLMTPGYQAIKALGIGGVDATPPSMQQLKLGMLGSLAGTQDWARKNFK